MVELRFYDLVKAWAWEEIEDDSEGLESARIYGEYVEYATTMEELFLFPYTESGWTWDAISVNHIKKDQNLKRRLRVKNPKGDWWGLSDCLSELGRKVMVGDRRQIDAKVALDFFNVLYNFYGAKNFGLDKDLERTIYALLKVEPLDTDGEKYFPMELL